MKTKQGKELSKAEQNAVRAIITTVAEVAVVEHDEVKFSLNGMCIGGTSLVIHLDGRDINYHILKSGVVKYGVVQIR